MPTEIAVALITGVVSVIGFLLTFIISNKKLKADQVQRMTEYNDSLKEQITGFQKDTRDEISLLQDAFATHKVEIKDSYKDLQRTQEGFQKIMELRLDELEQQQGNMVSAIDRIYSLETRMAVVEERESHHG